ncbi:MAG TPA: ABC transporter substrate-binding protein [Acidimicrobiia bacterium]|nr:ABC transporter substrate-binding protein [Acidimicrobiia bacterium]
MRLSRLTRSVTGFAVIGLLLGACAPPSTTDTTAVATTAGPATTAADGATTTAAPTETTAAAVGGRVIVGRTGDIDNLDPHLATAFQTIDALELVYDTLFELDANLDIQPGLAADYSYSDDGTELTLNLREGVTFHDGDPFTSADVVASLERILDEATGAVGRNFILSIEEITAPDDMTVVLGLAVADGTLPSVLTRVNTSIMSDASIEAGTVGTEPNGTGPFDFVEWNQGESVELDTFGDYWGDAPSVEGVSIRVLPEDTSLLAALQAGEIHIGIITNPAVLEQAAAPLVVETAPALGYFPFFLNSSRGPLQEKAVRQAISCAIDRQQLIDAALFGNGVETGPYVIGDFASDPWEGLPCDGPDKDLARQLLADAGFADGFSIETIIISGESEININIGQNLQAQLAEIGVDLQLEQLETNVYVDRWLAADFDSALSENGAGPDPHHTYVRYFTSEGVFQNVAGLSSPELDDLILQGQTTTDPAARVEIYNQISQILLDESPWVWLFRGFRTQVLVPEVEGFISHPTGSLKSLRGVTLGSG